MNAFKPMLASEAPDIREFPLYASPKLDGVRCLVIGGQAVSRSLKAIPNKYIQEWVGKCLPDGLDGELIVGDPCAPDVYRLTSSGVMSRDGVPDFHFYVFDHTAPNVHYRNRLQSLQGYFFGGPAADRLHLLEQRLIINEAELLEYEREVLSLGFEGLILRAPGGLYKYGRSTAREGYLLKLKRFADGEARVVGFDELMHNGNPAQLDELGHTKRSSHHENLVPMNTLGALHVVDVVTGVAFKIGTGYSAYHRKQIWDRRAHIVGEVVKYKHFEIGVKDAPRFPVWLGFRDALDM